MWLSLIVIVLVLAIAYYQATQGLFSAMIMMVLTICCAAAAFGAFEWVAVNWLAGLWKPNFAHAIALGVIFGVPLLILRLVLDRLVRRDCLLPDWVGRIGGGICGLVTAMTMVGVATAAVQMLPFGESILGFSRFDVAQVRESGSDVRPQDLAAERNLWLGPDRFAVTVASMLSNGLFNTEHKLHEAYPDLIQAAGWVNTVKSEVSRYAPPKSISIVEAKPVRFVYRLTPGNEQRSQPPVYEVVDTTPGNVLQMVRVRLGNKARDERKSHTFTLRQFRLVGQREPEGAYVQYFPIGIQQEDAEDVTNRHIRFEKDGRGDWPVVDTNYSPRGGGNEVELVFEVPASFVPSFLEYKRNARAAVAFAQLGSEDETQSAAPPPPPRRPGVPEAAESETVASTAPQEQPSGRRSRRVRGEETVPDSGRGGRVRGATTRSAQSQFGDQLPMTLTAYQSVRNVEAVRGVLQSGHVLARVDGQEGGTNEPLSKFAVPEDKRLLQLNVQALQAGSLFGRAMAQAITTVQNYTVTDANGREFKVIGKYAEADVRGETILEIQYFPEQAGTVGGLGRFNRIKEDELTAQDQYVLLFLVEPGAQIVSFSTGGAASRADDLRGENLVAPQ